MEQRALIWLVVLASIGFALILWPFIGAVLWAVFIAIVFHPVHLRVQGQTGQRRPNLAALLTLGLIVLIVIVPLALVGTSVVQEAAALVEKLRSGQVPFAEYFQRMVDALPGWARGLLERLGIIDLAALQQFASNLFTRSGQAIGTHILGIGQNTLDFVVAFFLMLYLLFFLLRDGVDLSRRMIEMSPLARLHTSRLFGQFVTVVRATVKGNIVIALIQGTLGGIAFAVLGLPGAVLWGALMALLSLLPAVGAALVWAPVALYYAATGAWSGAIGLTLWGVLAIGLVDNLLRPLLVGKDTRMPDYLVLIATIGGISVFGLNGFVIGPVIAAVFLVAWKLFTSERQRPPED